MTFNADVTIRMGAEDHASAVVDNSAKRINRSWIEMRNQQRAVGRQFELNNRGFFQAARAIQQVGNIAQRAIGIFQAYQLNQIRINDLNREAAELQRDYARAIAEGDFDEAAKIQERQKQVIEDTTRALQEQILQWIVYGAIIAGEASRISKVIPFFSRFKDIFRAPKATAPPSPAIPSAVPKGKIRGRFPIGKVGGAVAGGLASAGLYLGQLAGEQTAGGGEGGDVAGGFDAILNLLYKITGENKIIINVDVNGTSKRVVMTKDPETGQYTYGSVEQ